MTSEIKITDVSDISNQQIRREIEEDTKILNERMKRFHERFRRLQIENYQKKMEFKEISKENEQPQQTRGSGMESLKEKEKILIETAKKDIDRIFLYNSELFKLLQKLILNALESNNYSASAMNELVSIYNEVVKYFQKDKQYQEEEKKYKKSLTEYKQQSEKFRQFKEWEIANPEMRGKAQHIPKEYTQRTEPIFEYENKPLPMREPEPYPALTNEILSLFRNLLDTNLSEQIRKEIYAYMKEAYTEKPLVVTNTFKSVKETIYVEYSMREKYNGCIKKVNLVNPNSKITETIEILINMEIKEDVKVIETDHHVIVLQLNENDKKNYIVKEGFDSKRNITVWNIICIVDELPENRFTMFNGKVENLKTSDMNQGRYWEIIVARFDGSECIFQVWLRNKWNEVIKEKEERKRKQEEAEKQRKEDEERRKKWEAWKKEQEEAEKWRKQEEAQIKKKQEEERKRMKYGQVSSQNSISSRRQTTSSQPQHNQTIPTAISLDPLVVNQYTQYPQQVQPRRFTVDGMGGKPLPQPPQQQSREKKYKIISQNRDPFYNGFRKYYSFNLVNTMNQNDRKTLFVDIWARPPANRDMSTFQKVHEFYQNGCRDFLINIYPSVLFRKHKDYIYWKTEKGGHWYDSERLPVRYVFEYERKPQNMYVETDIIIEGTVYGEKIQIPLVIPFSENFMKERIKVVCLNNYIHNPNDPNEFISAVFMNKD